METLRINALALYLGVEVEELNVSAYDDNVIECGNEEYLVVTDDEADDLWEQDLDNYLEECIYPELPDSIRNYFDEDAWKHDARFDGRAHYLARYDGDEADITVYSGETIDGEKYDVTDEYINSNGYEEILNGESETFYIYRQN